MSNIFLLDKRSKAAQSNRLRNINFHTKRKLLQENNEVKSAKELKCSGIDLPAGTTSPSPSVQDDSGQILFANISSSSSSSQDDSTQLLPGDLSSSSSVSLDQGVQNAGHTQDEHEASSAGKTPAKLDISKDIREYAREFSLPYRYVAGLLKALKPHHPTLPLSTRTLMGPRVDIPIQSFSSNRDDSEAEFAYFGITDTLLKIVNPILHPRRILKLQFSFDGLTLFNSSKREFWPILGKVYTEDNDYKPFVVAIYSGVGKPRCVHEYLWQFVKEINRLLSHGIRIDNEDFRVELMSFVCDTLARAFVKGCKGHTGFHGCERCNIVGFKVDNTTIFPIFGATPRTDADFRIRADLEHHNEISPLVHIRPKIDMVLLFILDFMHLVCLGVMKKLLVDYWTVPSLKILSREKLALFCLRLTNLRNQIPSDFQRSTASLHDVAQWKATEFRFFLLYCGMFVLKDILPEKHYKHFMLLCVACRILSSQKFHKIYLPQAREYLQMFVKASIHPKLYGATFLVINSHNLTHLADDVENMDCPVMDYSAFPFENALKKIKDLVESGNKPLAQACNKIQYYVQCEKPVKKPEFEASGGKKSGGHISYKNVKIRNCNISLGGNNNNVVSLHNGDLMRIKSIRSNTKNCGPDQIVIKGTRVSIVGSAFTYPCDSSLLDIHRVRENELETIESTLASVAQKWILMKINDIPGSVIESYAMPLLHLN
ncbi:hypothetical protein QAD02_014613 [Eretmocerus hayati]|uniref:Uncharacterized protein n=2 Tax=Eretmocerus hayati TaxID=131215 RepID=A0ACC2P719_9HYME|nr:hypothetical protein QAD02_014610 [Eretmocerus hayati]KAJ8678826.1 hypothetical protein QAD02_014613 [Eretmocerus hayati]